MYICRRGFAGKTGRGRFGSDGMRMLVRHCLMIMLVIVAVLTVNMDMCMGVRMFVGMDGVSVAVLVRMRVVMLVGVL